jgi:hypothetical protein
VGLQELVGWPAYRPEKALGRARGKYSNLLHYQRPIGIANEAFGLIEISKCLLLLMMDKFSGTLDMFLSRGFCDVGL